MVLRCFPPVSLQAQVSSSASAPPICGAAVGQQYRIVLRRMCRSSNARLRPAVRIDPVKWLPCGLALRVGLRIGCLFGLHDVVPLRAYVVGRVIVLRCCTSTPEDRLALCMLPHSVPVALSEVTWRLLLGPYWDWSRMTTPVGNTSSIHALLAAEGQLRFTFPCYRALSPEKRKSKRVRPIIVGKPEPAPAQ